MKPLLTLAAAAASITLALPAAAITTQFVATLNGALTGSPGLGTAQVALNDGAFTVKVHVDFSGLTGGPASAAHIHCCTATPGVQSAPVYLGFGGFPAATSGSYDQTSTLTSASFNTLFTGIQEGRAYVNIHNSAFPGGEINGFLAAVPEPGTWALMLGGLGLVGAAVGRQRAG